MIAATTLVDLARWFNERPLLGILAAIGFIIMISDVLKHIAKQDEERDRKGKR